ncbi:MAG: PAS domain-containing sensor histidine kinase [Bacteroidota bacterium]
MQDLSDQKQFKALFDFATEGILVSDTSGNIELANPAAERLFGYDAGELINSKVEILIPQRFAQNHHKLREGFHTCPHARSMGTGRDLFGVAKNGREFPIEISLSPFSAGSEDFVIAFIIDISVRKQNEEAIVKQRTELEALAHELEQRVKDRTMILEEALQQLERSRKELNETLDKEKELNEMKSRFVSMASHEIRTPLTTILSSLSLVEKYSENDNKEKQQQHIKRIRSSISNLTDLLDDVLSITKLEEGRIMMSPEEMDLKYFIEQLIKELKNSTADHQRIEYLHVGMTRVFLDKKIVRIICINLITNALKFSDEHTSIAVVVHVSRQAITLKVEDNGIGIAEEDRAHLFERFFRGGNASNIQGTGLGLNIVARYIEILGGTISVESKINEKTIFTVTIPNQTTDEKENITD